MDREDRIKHMFYDWDNERKIMLDIQKCQRNWDHDKWFKVNKELRKEVINELLWVATNAPSKQHEGYYDVYYTDDRNVIQEISRYTWGYTHRRNPPATWRNSQSNASIYILFVAKEPDSQLNCNADGTLKSNTDKNRWQNAYCSIGIAIGLTMRAAAKMGFQTGCNKSHNDLNGDDFWEKRLGILDDVKAGKKQICYGLGIGYEKEGVERYISDETEIMIGAGNGGRITTTGQEVSPSEIKKGKKMRKAKIVSLIEQGGKEVKDPYGNVHNIPKKAEFKINSFRNRNIKITEIK
tara:strand:+ start:48 stop:929 length:882 start_codon:yes stop_codon:yes gene_type:complete